MLVAEWMAAGPTTLHSYPVLLFAACGSCFKAEYLRGLDGRSGMLRYERLPPLLAIWVAACGSMAILYKSVLNPCFRGWDILMKRLLRLRGGGRRALREAIGGIGLVSTGTRVARETGRGR